MRAARRLFTVLVAAAVLAPVPAFAGSAESSASTYCWAKAATSPSTWHGTWGKVRPDGGCDPASGGTLDSALTSVSPGDGGLDISVDWVFRTPGGERLFETTQTGLLFPTDAGVAVALDGIVIAGAHSGAATHDDGLSPDGGVHFSGLMVLGHGPA